MIDSDELEMVADNYYELFQGREDAVFVDNPPRLEKLGPTTPPLWDTLINHLTNEQGPSIGIYPLEGGNRCKWICSDFDTADAEQYAWAYARAWEYYGIQAWVETSRSKGFHVWVFADDWMSGTIARRASLWVHEMADIEAVELNPKQELLEDGGYGNCVRLPYPASAAPGRQTMWDQAGTPIPLGDWVWQAIELTTPVSQLQRLAAMWKPKERPASSPSTYTGDRTGGNSGDNAHIVSVFRGETDVKTGERDLVFFTLAKHMKGLGMEMDEALGVVQEVWEEQTEDKATYPFKEAVAKVKRAYGATR